MPVAGEFVFHAATRTDIARLRRALIASGAFLDEMELERVWTAEPWRVQVTERGDAAVVSRWREHIDTLAVEALWCSQRDIPRAMEQLLVLARERGFGDLIGPPVPLGEVQPYCSAGMHVFETLATFRWKATRDIPGAGPVPGVSSAEASEEDIEALLELDGLCFDRFWRYDQDRMERSLAHERVVIARSAEGAIGYTLSTVRRGSGLLGRIGVAPGHRSRGVGRMLVVEATDALAARGADAVMLWTQRDNHAARALYTASGFVDVDQPVAFVRFGEGSL